MPLITPVMAGNVMSDINMLVVLHGRERTEREFHALLDAAGLRPTAMTGALASSAYRVIEAAPAG